MARGRKKKEYKAKNYKNETWYITDSNDKYIDECDVEAWHGDEYKYFGYKYQSDFIVDLVIHKKWGYYYKIVEAGGLKKLKGILDESDEAAMIISYEKHYNNAINGHYRPLDETSEKRYLEAKKEVYKRNYNLAGERNKAKFDAEMKRLDSICKTIEDLSEHKNLDRILKTYRVHLSHLVQYARNMLIATENLQYKGKDKYTFSVSTRFFAEHLNSKGVKTNYKNIAKMFNLFSLLGFINKEFDEAKRLYKNDDDMAYNITYLSISQIDLSSAEYIATRLIENGYKFNSFSGKYVLQVFGAEVYEKTFAKPNKRVKIIPEQQGTSYEVNISEEGVEVIRLDKLNESTVTTLTYSNDEDLEF